MKACRCVRLHQRFMGGKIVDTTKCKIHNVGGSGNNEEPKTRKNEEMTSIDLTNEDAQAFKIFRKYQEKIMLLHTNGVFVLKNGLVQIHVDKDGTYQEISTTQVKFKRKKNAHKKLYNQSPI